MNNRRVFVSYSRRDVNLVKPLVGLMRTSGSGVFRDEDDIRPGMRWKTEITTAVSECEIVVLFWCHHSAASDEVRKEYQLAIELDKEIAPVLLDSTLLEARLREYQYIDMRAFTEPAHDGLALRGGAADFSPGWRAHFVSALSGLLCQRQ